MRSRFIKILSAAWRPVTLIGWALAVASLTLYSRGLRPDAVGSLTATCLVCGTRGMADSILNVALFVPLGVSLGRDRRRIGVALLVGLCLSLGIEFAQLYVPGRHASLADLLWNATGAGTGAALFLAVRAQTRRPGIRFGPWPWLGGVALLLVAFGALTVPSRTRVDYWGQWTPDLGSMPQYRGRVLSAELNGEPMGSRRLRHARPHHLLFADDWSLQGVLEVGPRPGSVSPILSIYDAEAREIVLLGAHHDDLVFRERRAAAVARLDVPDLRIPDAFAGLQQGDTVTLGVRRAGGTLCLGLAGEEWCGPGVTPARTWGYLLYLEGPPERFRLIVDVLWLVGLFAIVGFFARAPGEAALAIVGGLSAVALAAATTPLVTGPWAEWLAVGVGVGVGQGTLWALRRVVYAVAKSETQPRSAAAIASRV